MTQVPTNKASGASTARRLPFDASERKKIMVLAGLAIVCAVVVLPQLLKNHGPATAMAATPGDAVVTLDLEDTVRQMRADAKTGGATSGAKKGPLLFNNVDDALDVFVGGARPQSVPVSELRLSVFGLPALLSPNADKGIQDAARAAAAVEAGAGDPAQAELDTVTLETVLKSSRNCAAIIDGQVLHVGEQVLTFTITKIETGEVTLQRDGKLYTLRLK
jgi:hypothetical protein